MSRRAFTVPHREPAINADIIHETTTPILDMITENVSGLIWGGLGDTRKEVIDF